MITGIPRTKLCDSGMLDTSDWSVFGLKIKVSCSILFKFLFCVLSLVNLFTCLAYVRF